MEMEDKNELFDFCNSFKKWWRCIIKEIVFIKWDRYLNEFDYFFINVEVQDILSLKFVEDGWLVLKVVDVVEEISDLLIK